MVNREVILRINLGGTNIHNMIRTPDRQGHEQADMIAYILHNPEKPSETMPWGGHPRVDLRLFTNFRRTSPGHPFHFGQTRDIDGDHYSISI